MESPVSFDEEMESKYLKVKELMDLTSKKDPVSEPYKSKYEARELLCEMKTTLSNKEDRNGELDIREKSMLAAVLSILGTLSMDVEEPSTGEEYLNKTLDLLKDDYVNPYYILTVVATLNQLGLLYFIRHKNQECLKYLVEADNAYSDYKEMQDAEPVDYMKLFANIETSGKGSDILEKTHTITYCYLAQVYKEMGAHDKSALYCHYTLKRQIEFDDLDKIDWALNSASLSQYLINKNSFRVAKHHLAAATYMMDLKKNELEVIKDESEEYQAKLEEYNHRKTDVLRCWTKYCVALFSNSKDRLLEDSMKMPGEHFNINFCTFTPTLTTPFTFGSPYKDLYFSGLDIEDWEEVVTSDFILTYEDAKPVFAYAIDCCNKSMKYYSLEDHATDYVNIVQDVSQLYENLAFFEDDENKQCKLFKKQKDLLTKTVSSLNEVYYLDVCRALWKEIGTVCATMASIKADRAKEDPSQHRINKVNTIANDGLKYLGLYINSFHDKTTNKLPDTYMKEYEREILMAIFYSAQLNMKIKDPDKTKVVENHTTSLNLYKEIVDYCNRNETAKFNFAAEIGICKDMALLLPREIERLVKRLSSN